MKKVRRLTSGPSVDGDARAVWMFGEFRCHVPMILSSKRTLKENARPLRPARGKFGPVPRRAD